MNYLAYRFGGIFGVALVSFFPVLIILWIAKKYCAKHALPYQINILKDGAKFAILIGVLSFCGLNSSLIGHGLMAGIICSIAVYVLF